MLLEEERFLWSVFTSAIKKGSRGEDVEDCMCEAHLDPVPLSLSLSALILGHKGDATRYKGRLQRFVRHGRFVPRL